MTLTITLDRVLSLPIADIKALQEGKTIATLPIAQVQKGWSFILYPHPEDECGGDTYLETWATCENFSMIHEVEKALILSSLTPWKQSELERFFEDRGHLSLALLRAYRLPEPIVISSTVSSGIKPGKFIGLSHFGEDFKESIQVTKVLPILSETIFANRQQQILKFRPPEYPELEELQGTIALYTQAHPEARKFDDDLRVFLGWSDLQKAQISDSNWTDETITITEAGNSSDGYLFEKLVRQAFIYLGFTNNLNNPKAALDPNGMGGAGGIDIYCEKPFPIVGECKASGLGNVGNAVCAQLINLGNTNLGKDRFEAAVKIIFAAGKLNTIHAEPAAKENKMNVMRPNTLQRLVELKSAHPGSIDLMELEPCLRSEPFGTDADSKVNKFIDNIWNELKIRSLIIRTVKTLQEGNEKNISSTVVRVHFNAIAATEIDYRLDTDSIAHSFLVELSSPLTGYLGRIKCDTWRGDRFYFLRDLIV